MPSGNKQQEGSCPHLRQGKLLLCAPLTCGLGVSSGWGRGTMPDYGATGALEGLKGREEKVGLSLEGILLTIFSPFPRGCRCFPTRLCGCAGQSRLHCRNIPLTGRGGWTRLRSGSP